MRLECKFYLNSNFLIPAQDKEGRTYYDMMLFGRMWRIQGTIHRMPDAGETINVHELEWVDVYSDPDELKNFTQERIDDFIVKAKEEVMKIPKLNTVQEIPTSIKI